MVNLSPPFGKVSIYDRSVCFKGGFGLFAFGKTIRWGMKLSPEIGRPSGITTFAVLNVDAQVGATPKEDTRLVPLTLN